MAAFFPSELVKKVPFGGVDAALRGEHASRGLVAASRRNALFREAARRTLFIQWINFAPWDEVCTDATRALPGNPAPWAHPPRILAFSNLFHAPLL